jgi:periplasmic protein TonB
MEQPFHSMKAAQNKGLTPEKIVGMGLAIALQIGFVWALATGLAGTLIEKLPDELKVAVEQEKIPPKAPPPPPPQLETPPPPFVPPPDIVIQTEAPPTTTITTTAVKPVQQVEHKAISSPASVGRTHSCMQNYPVLSQKMNEEGTTTLSFHIKADGSVADVAVAKSSGFSRLDDAAVSCAQRWTYKPAMQDGQPVEVPWQTNVQWKLH